MVYVAKYVTKCISNAQLNTIIIACKNGICTSNNLLRNYRTEYGLWNCLCLLIEFFCVTWIIELWIWPICLMEAWKTMKWFMQTPDLHRHPRYITYSNLFWKSSSYLSTILKTIILSAIKVKHLQNVITNIAPSWPNRQIHHDEIISAISVIFTFWFKLFFIAW